MICIDLPYNTGNDFIYPDNYTESPDTYLRYTGQLDSEGRRYSTNTETDGRFHSKWLSMMYPRLFLARNLLREDGVIFISVDDNEIHNLRILMNEIFGEENFIDT
ncbi:MAG: site-specific DNA-methyltransferase [Candidatus Brocadia sp. AMX2]|uniref:Adenine specific DNA methylase n=1 Tax=Candidatus Brocadia sinica JPN1 TaxID=1197129 RepID=A0ABQ0JXJ3_9BACT|nr:MULTISPECIES: site-specific DNA-methyltransferase [Brocadia]KXK33137.1 MAG: adenine specific DNA methylase [Candidatus Brocadia sinica]MBC6934169.1 site-specific DNA-methyltransferase [Candidatus Brocadia sp.]MBL1170759.1 site-specific DNA-methyltransferase [Candidatus Brocadia sp. AMX1]NOG40737.1 site-specific DNA-methyltransferase [Planctomycetota bacterium]NUQ57756.1 site-specific DNA-methyltransferase [Candidatus Paceibacter sp.]